MPRSVHLGRGPDVINSRHWSSMPRRSGSVSYDGWWYLQWAATMDPQRYLIQFIDPSNITQGYRPVQGLYIYLLYNLVGSIRTAIMSPKPCFTPPTRSSCFCCITGGPPTASGFAGRGSSMPFRRFTIGGFLARSLSTL